MLFQIAFSDSVKRTFTDVQTIHYGRYSWILDKLFLKKILFCDLSYPCLDLNLILQSCTFEKNNYKWSF